MFRVQVWHEGLSCYANVVLSFDHRGVVGFRFAQLGDSIAEYSDPSAAWCDVVDLQARYHGAIVALLDTSTGVRHFEDRYLPETAAAAPAEPEAPAALTDDWIIQRAVRIRLARDGGDVYEPWPGYTHAMTRDQAVRALEECEERWPEHEFRAHRLRLDEKMAADAIERARRSARAGKRE